MAKAHDLLVPIRRVVHERVFLMPVDEVQILTAKLGTDAGIVGMAAWSARGEIKSKDVISFRSRSSIRDTRIITMKVRRVE